MATYKQMERYIRKTYGFVPKSCWIAHMKEKCNLPVKRAWNRAGGTRVIPCPTDKESAIISAFKHFGLIK